MAITLGKVSFGDGGSGGGSRVGALLRQHGDTSLGLFIGYSGADESWHLRGVAREAAEPSVAATARISHDASNYLDLTFADADDTREKKFTPLVGNDRNDFPEQVNEYQFTTIQWPAPVTEVKASLDYGDLRVTSRRAAGAAGNDDSVQVAIGTAATSDVNAHADIPLYNGTPGVLRAGQIRVTSPDRAQGGEYAAPPSYFILDRFSFRATERGTAGNALEFQIRSVVDADQAAAETWTAAYTDDNTLRVTVTFNSGVATERRTFTSSLFVAAFNAATDSNGGKPITLIDGFPSHPDSVNWRLSAGTNAPFSGGTDVSGGGSPTNFGGIVLVSSGARSAAVQASTTWGNVVLTANAAGAFPNNGKYQAQVVGTNSGGHQYRVTRSDLTGGRHFQVLLDSSVGANPTVAQVVRGLNDADTENLITAAPASGVSDTSVAWTGTGTQSFTGGADAVNPLAASWDADSHTLTITALDSDPASDVITAITALDEFGTNVGPGYVRLAGGGLTTGVVNVDNTVGNTLSYSFAGGTDGQARSTLTVVNRNDPDGSGNRLDIRGLINGDTTQDVISAYTGNRFTLTSVSGDATTAFSNPAAFGPTPPTGGVNQVARQDPWVYVSAATNEAITYTIWYHGSQTPAGQRTTLTEMKVAWDSISEVDGLHGTSPTSAITGTGSNVVATIPTGPTGGADREDADVLEAIARPEDEVHGPNVELRYDPSEENLQAIHDALEAQGVVTVVGVYGTDLTANPENPPFSRTMFLAAGVSEGISGVTIEDEGTALTQAATTLNFTGDGVTASGTGATKTITIPGGSDGFDLHDDVTSEATSLNANALDRFLVSRESETGDPNAYMTAANVRAFMKGYVGTWASRPGGFVFRIGDITDHSGMWYVTKVQHSKQANGPDTDPTNFIAISTWGGAWAAGYFHVGTFVTHANEVWVSTDTVLNSDPAPNDASNTKWTQISGGGGGSAPTSLAGLPIPEWATGSNYAAWVLIRDSHGRIYVTTQAITNSTIEPARSTDFQAIDGYEGPYADNTGYPAGAIVTDDSDDIYFVVAAVSDSNTTAPADSSAFVQINGGGGTVVVANPGGTADGGDLTTVTIDGTIYDIPAGSGPSGSGGSFVTELGRGTPTIAAGRVLDTGIDIPDTVGADEWWAFQLRGTAMLGLYIFKADQLTGLGNAPISGSAVVNANTDNRFIRFIGNHQNTEQTVGFGRTAEGDITFIVPGTTVRPNPIVLYRMGTGGAGGTEVEANPDGAVDSGALTKLDVDGSIYSVGGGGSATLSDADPQPAGTAAAGTSTEASRADHVHASELVDDAITPAMLDADSADDKAALRTRIGAVSARANPSEAVDGGELTKVDIDGTIYEVPEGTFDLSDKVGATLTGIDGTATQGPAFSDLNPVVWLSFSYTRSPNTSLRFNSLVRKAEIEGLAAGSAYRLQGQGAGGAFFSLWETSGNLSISVSDTTSYPLVALDIYNVKGATGGSGGGADLSLANPEPLGTASPGTGTEASRSDHVHPTELVDDVITPAMLVADSAGEKTAMRTRIGAGTSSLTTGNVDARINPIARVGNTDRWPTNKLNTDVVLTAELTAAIAGFLSQTQVDARVTALVNALALSSNTGRWGKTRLPTDAVYDADIANFRTATQITAQITAALADLAEWKDAWTSGDAYTTGNVVRHNNAAYIALTTVAANTASTTEPGVGTLWLRSWYRLGYRDGAPNSLLTASFDTGNGELVLRSRDATARRVAIPTGGTTVVANPAGSDGDDLDRLSVGGTNFNIPHFRPIQIGSADFGNTTTAEIYRAHASGSGIDRPSSVPAGEWWALTVSDRTFGANLYIFPADSVPVGRSVGQSSTANATRGARIALSQNRGLFLAWTTAGKLLVAGDTINENINELTLFRMGLGDDPAADPGNLRPSIASFVSTSGDLSPAAGSIATHVYGASWAISQSDHVGSARIIGFKGAFDASNVAVLHSITAGNYAHGATTFSIPSGITLAADETYTQRLQVFAEGITNPGNATQPAAYHDIVITAHAPATANYQWGWVEAVDNETNAQTATRIAGWTSWQDTNTTNGGRTTETDGTLNTSTGYSALAPDVSDSDGTNLFLFFLAVKSGEPKPTGWSGNGLDASGAFNAGVDQTVGSTTYTFYILKSFLSRNHADGDIRYIPRTS